MIRILCTGGFVLLAFGYLGVLSEVDAIDQDTAEKALRVERARAETVRRPRESWALTHPLSCSGSWIRSCADFLPCKYSCFAERSRDH